jgi:hypothetical protein
VLVFHTYINEMHGYEAKSPVKNLVRPRRMEGFNSDVKGLMSDELLYRTTITRLFHVNV